MAFTPNPNLFNNAVAGGLRNGQSLLDTINRRREQSQLQELAQIAPGGDFNQIGSQLIRMGQVNSGLEAINTPYEREQDSQLAQLNQQKFQAVQDQRGIQNQLGRDRLNQSQANADRTFDYKVGRDVFEDAQPSEGSFTKPFQALVDGKRVWVQSDQSGNTKVLDGFAPLNALQKTDTGTEIIMTDRAGNVVSRTPKTNQEKARQTAIGKIEGTTQAEAVADLPRVTSQTNEMVSVIDGILNDPALPKAVGNIDSRIPDWMAGQDVVDFRTKVDQIEGKTFLQAFQSLKGGGQITEAEGRKATAAIARLPTKQSEQAFRESLNELREIVANVQLRASQKAQVNGDAIPSPMQVNELNKPAIDRIPLTDILKKYGG